MKTQRKLQGCAKSIARISTRIFRAEFLTFAVLGAALLAILSPYSLRADPLPSWCIGPFVRPATGNPIIKPDPNATFDCPLAKTAIHWEYSHTFNPCAIVRNDKVYVLYRSEDETGHSIGGYTSRLGMAVSTDGIHFTTMPAPVLYPANDSQTDREWPGGCEDPRLVEAPDGTYVIVYTQWNRKIGRAAVATSKDLVTWVKHGPAFDKAYGGKYANLRDKSASIVTHLQNGRLIAAKINGKYWMYWGEGTIHFATSDNLIDWQPVEDSSGNLLTALGTRPGKFDSDLAEGGPPPVLTADGIVVLYNGKNRDSSDVAGGAYSGGQALFSATDPTKLVDRLDHPFYKPEMDWERTGQYAAGTTFIEGLVAFKGRWFLYYGCADTFVAVAVANNPPLEKR